MKGYMKFSLCTNINVMEQNQFIWMSYKARRKRESKTRNEEQETERFSKFAVYRLLFFETKKFLDSRIMF